MNPAFDVIAGLLAATALHLQYGNFERGLLTLNCAIDEIRAAMDVLPADVLVRAAQLAEVLGLLAGERQDQEAA